MWLRKCKLTGFIWYYINSYSYPIFDDFCLDNLQRLGYWTMSNQTTLRVPRLAILTSDTIQSPAAGKPDSTRQVTGETKMSVRKQSTAQDEVRL